MSQTSVRWRLLPVSLMLCGLPGLLAACGKQGAESHAVAASPVDVMVGAPQPEPPPVVTPPSTAREREGDGVGATTAKAAASDPALLEPEPEALPKSWTGPIVPGLSFADALRKARSARDAYGRLAAPGAATASAAAARDAGLKTWFTRAQALTDVASRSYAAAFHAPDASREGRIDAIAEAAELDMTMARNLDEAGLGSLPVAWRSDPAVPSTFEDIAVGPTRRWRDEARVLARQCVDSARDSGVITEAARRCAALRTGAPIKVTVRHGADAGAGAPCACAAGDPLCSASLGGWCGGPR